MLTVDEGRTPDHGYTISSPGEPYDSGELITPDATKYENGLSKMIWMGKSICHIWVKVYLRVSSA